MPSPDLACEFCKEHKTIRKNLMAEHVKNHHKKELADLLLTEFVNENFSSLDRFSKNIRNNPVYSKLHTDAVYYFGGTPMLFLEDDSYATYIKSEINMNLHNQFLEELLEHITLKQYLDAQKKLIIKSQEFLQAKKELVELGSKLRVAQVELDELKNKNARLEEEIKEYRAELDVPGSIQTLKEDLKYERTANTLLTKEVEGLKAKMGRHEEDKQKQIDEVWESSLKKQRELNNQIDELYNVNKTLKEEIQELTVKKDKAVAKETEHLKKEYEKEADKLKKENEKETKKLKDKITKLQEQKEDLEEELEDTKSKIKRLQRKSKKSKSSDSEDSD